jgi:hypothetical protein
MFANGSELRKYVIENFVEVTDSRFNDEHWDFICTSTKCGIARGFQVVRRTHAVSQGGYGGSYSPDYDAPIVYLFKCPVCKAFRQWIIYEFQSQSVMHYFRLAAVPGEGLEDISELPEQPPSLRAAYREAIRAMDANANIAAAAMFRRALQIITRDVLGAKHDKLANELKALVGTQFNGVTIKSSFATVGYIIKEAGNQVAHPDKDPDLLTFTATDAQDLQNIFMELVSDLFIVPAAALKTKEDFMARRKIKPPLLPLKLNQTLSH